MSVVSIEFRYNIAQHSAPVAIALASYGCAVHKLQLFNIYHSEIGSICFEISVTLRCIFKDRSDNSIIFMIVSF